MLTNHHTLLPVHATPTGLWAVDSPSYFTEGIYVRLIGPILTDNHVAEVAERFPEWSPQRHMHIDAIQRAAVRDLLAMSIAFDWQNFSMPGIMILPELKCFCERYWDFLSRCRFGLFRGARNLPMPFSCPQVCKAESLTPDHSFGAWRTCLHLSP
jgi:arabinosyltransferase|mmetsp:Transcript_12289/g.28036  ORF Transcript_12289/g.28036 Transcript_12289/m.28036 type:complete len:155 (+) Transcript_12289:853-1317(+)